MQLTRAEGLISMMTDSEMQTKSFVLAEKVSIQSIVETNQLITQTIPIETTKLTQTAT